MIAMRLMSYNDADARVLFGRAAQYTFPSLPSDAVTDIEVSVDDIMNNGW